MSSSTQNSKVYWTGFVGFRALYKEETKWFYSRGTEFGLWWLTIHAFSLRLEIIGPFNRVKAVV